MLGKIKVGGKYMLNNEVVRVVEIDGDSVKYVYECDVKTRDLERFKDKISGECITAKDLPILKGGFELHGVELVVGNKYRFWVNGITYQVFKLVDYNEWNETLTFFNHNLNVNQLLKFSEITAVEVGYL